MQLPIIAGTGKELKQKKVFANKALMIIAGCRPKINPYLKKTFSLTYLGARKMSPTLISLNPLAVKLELQNQIRITKKKDMTMINIFEILTKYENFVYEEADFCGKCLGCSCYSSKPENSIKVGFGQLWKMSSGGYVPEYVVSDGGTCYKPSVKRVYFDPKTGDPYYKKIKSLPEKLQPILMPMSTRN